MTSIGRDVVEEARGAVYVGDHGVEASVIVKVGEGHSAIVPGALEVVASKLRPVFEPSIAEIAQQRVGQSSLGPKKALECGKMRVGGEDVLESVIVEIEKPNSPAGKGAGGDGKARARGDIFESRRATGVAVERIGVVGQRREDQIGSAVVIVIPEINSHAGHGAALVIQRNSRQQRDFLEFAVAEVVKQKIRHGIIGDEDIGQTVAIVVGNGDPHALSDLIGETGGRGDIGEGTVVVVAEHLIGRAAIGAGIAIALMLLGAAAGFGLRIPLHVVTDDKIEPAVIVYVNPGRRDRPQLAQLRIDTTEVSFLGDIFERAVAAIVVKNVAVHPGDEDIGIAVVVVVGDGNAHGVAFACYPGFFGHVGEGSVAIVAKQAIGIFGARLL